MTHVSYERAITDPAGAFASPEAILESDLDLEQKRKLLQRWRERHQAGGEPDLLTRLGRALSFLDTETGRQPTTQPQGMYGAIQDLNDPSPDRRRD